MKRVILFVLMLAMVLILTPGCAETTTETKNKGFDYSKTLIKGDFVIIPLDLDIDEDNVFTEVLGIVSGFEKAKGKKIKNWNIIIDHRVTNEIVGIAVTLEENKPAANDEEPEQEEDQEEGQYESDYLDETKY